MNELDNQPKIALAAKEKTIGDQFFDNDHFKEALFHYTNAIELNPDDVRLLGNRSLTYYNLKMYKEASADAEKSLEIDPHYFKGYVRKYRSLYQLGKIEESEEVFAMACRLFPELQDQMALARAVATTETQTFFQRLSNYFSNGNATSDHRDLDLPNDRDVDTFVINRRHEEGEELSAIRRRPSSYKNE